MAKYNLTPSTLEKNFTFEIDGKEFVFTKPTVREMRAVAKKFSGISEETDQDKQIELSDEAMGELYKFVSPVNHDANISDVLSDQTVEVQNAFNTMIQDELGFKS